MSFGTAPVELHLYQLHPFQERIRAEARRFNVLALGRRAGKTTLGEDLVVETVLDDHAPFGLFAPNYQSLAENWRSLRDTLRPVARRISEAEHRIEIIGGGVLDCWSLDSENVADSARGRRYKRVGIEEAGSVPNLLDVWGKVIRPMLTDLRGDAWFWGTPKGLNGFYTLWLRGQDDSAENDWKSWRAPTLVNPYIDPAEVEAARRDLPEQSFEQEYNAAFLADGTSVFRHVGDALTARWQDGPIPGHEYVIGCDWGQVNDFTVFSVVDCTLAAQAHLERSNQVDYVVQAARLRILAEKFRPRLIVPEINSIGRVVIELLRQWNLPVWAFDTTNATKAAVVQALQLAFDQRAIAILPDEIQKGELMAFTSERLPSGLLRYGAPEGMHDDCVIALALAWAGACAGDGRPRVRDFRVEA